MPTTPTPSTAPFGRSLLDMLYGSSPIGRLREQRKPTTTTKPKKPRSVTDEQLLEIVDELLAKNEALSQNVEALRYELAGQRDYVRANYKLKFNAPIKKEIIEVGAMQAIAPRRG